MQWHGESTLQMRRKVLEKDTLSIFKLSRSFHHLLLDDSMYGVFLCVEIYLFSNRRPHSQPLIHPALIFEKLWIHLN